LATSVATIGLSGCSSESGSSGGSDIIISGSTDFEETWDVDLEEGDELELELTLDTGVYALADVSRNDNADSVAMLETEEKETLTEQFTAPATVDYFVVLQATENGSQDANASLVLRRQ
jgi:hypothetical protein